MVSLKNLCTMLEKSGAINLHTTKNRQQSIYVVVTYVMFILYICGHLFSTVTRSIRYEPEFVQMIADDALYLMILLSINNYRAEYRLLGKLLYMESSFSKACHGIIKKCEREANLIFKFSLGAVFCANVEKIFKALLPIPSAELEIRRYVYRTENAHRRHPSNVRILFMDESKSYTYEIIYLFQSWIFVLLIVWITVVITFIPVLVVHMRGQYKILAKYIEKIGEVHRDPLGNAIVYTNIETDEYVVLKLKKRDGKTDRRIQMREKRELQNEYQRRYLIQIFKFHKRILMYQDQCVKLLSPIVLSLVMGHTIIFTLGLCQLVLSRTELSPQRLFTFISEFVAEAFAYFILCNCSEIANDCNLILCKAINTCSWTNCSSQTRRDISILLRRVQQPNHLRFYSGALILSRAYFLKVLKVAYTFLNFVLNV
ncbi:hypothetical protein M8J76_000223 [Diaphorina citri]|nr:hypothetical protein M8J76_000223 [Diaphorina citri]